MTDLQATCFVQLQATLNAYGRPIGVKVIRLTKSRPSSLANNSVAVGLTVAVPSAIFDALQAQVVIEAPDTPVPAWEAELLGGEPSQGIAEPETPNHE